MSRNFDIIVIGGGPGGYVAAIRAAQLGFKTAVIEEKHLGGICLNWGCIPTKALLKSAEVNNLIKHADEYGIKVSSSEIDFKKIISRSREVSKKLASGIGHLMKKNNITVIEARGKLNGPNQIRAFFSNGETEDIKTKNIIISTGARARILPNLEPDGKFIWTYKEAMVADTLPKNLLVVGSGAIGMEFANFYNSLGTKVTVIELADTILPVEDNEISKLATKEFSNQGINIKTNTTISNLEKLKSEVEVELKNSKNNKVELVKFDRIISAVGIVGNTEDIGLEGGKVKVDKGSILTDENCKTDEANVYAIGDVAGAPWLAHKASHEAVAAVEHIAGLGSHPLKKENIPGCTYTNPQIASVGLTEKAAKEQGYNLKVGRFPFMANGKAIASGKESGLIKTIFNSETGELLGAHMIGSEVTELIQGFVLAKTFEATEEDIMRTCFPHPTLSEMMHESVLDAYDKALHI
ncbi:MAG: dihydrolipoyl dehydrogenase [Alphaproteobacteria bacterium]|jgi:dihydrolipoamide dehydrogenase|nr:dihydrolipoyl dehydrogenase [Alphaproteobacteria bacterium]